MPNCVSLFLRGPGKVFYIYIIMGVENLVTLSISASFSRIRIRYIGLYCRGSVTIFLDCFLPLIKPACSRVEWNWIFFDFWKRALCMLSIRYIFTSPIPNNRRIWQLARQSFHFKKNQWDLKNYYFLKFSCTSKNNRQSTIRN